MDDSSLAETVAAIDRLSQPFRSKGHARIRSRLQAPLRRRAAAAALGESLRNLRSASPAMFARSVTMLGSADLDRLARLAAFAPRLREILASVRTPPEPQPLIAAMAAACVVAAGLERMGDDAVGFLRDVARSVISGIDVDTTFEEGGLRPLLELATVICAAREAESFAVCTRTPLDDAMTPRPWAGRDPQDAPILDLMSMPMGGDEVIRAQAKLIAVAAGSPRLQFGVVIATSLLEHLAARVNRLDLHTALESMAWELAQPKRLAPIRLEAEPCVMCTAVSGDPGRSACCPLRRKIR